MSGVLRPAFIAMRWVLLASMIPIALGCGERHLPSNAVKARKEPGPGDSLARLIRNMLVAPDPLVPYNEIMCETGRLIKRYGPEKAEVIRLQVMDTIYGPNDGPARSRVEAALARRVIYSDCDD